MGQCCVAMGQCCVAMALVCCPMTLEFLKVSHPDLWKRVPVYLCKVVVFYDKYGSD